MPLVPGFTSGPTPTAGPGFSLPVNAQRPSTPLGPPLPLVQVSPYLSTRKGPSLLFFSSFYWAHPYRWSRSLLTCQRAKALFVSVLTTTTAGPGRCPSARKVLSPNSSCKTQTCTQGSHLSHQSRSLPVGAQSFLHPRRNHQAPAFRIT